MNKKELMRYVRGIKDLADGYGVTDVLAWLGAFGIMYMVTIFVGAFI